MNILSAHSPVLLADGSISLMVIFDGWPGEIPFCASPVDTAAHGRDLYVRAHAGEFGVVSPYVAPVETLDQSRARLTDIVQRHLDDVAKSRGYDDILSAVTYANESSVPIFQTEGLAFRIWRSLAWQKCIDVMGAVTAGTRSIPTEAELISELPPPSLP